MIPEPFIQDLLERVDVVDVVGRYVALRKAGANLLGLCPFHNEKSPSFTVSPTKQFYHCFGCGAHGTAIRFLMEHTGASFPEAVRQLADSVGMAVPAESRDGGSLATQREQAVRRAQEARHGKVLEAANTWYRQQLRGAAEAIRYLKQRGLSGQIAARYGMGWAPGERRGLAHVFEAYDDPEFAELLVESGLVIASEDGRRYDRFRQRVTFPIRNARGHLIGFGGRLIGPGEPKYLNSPETPIFAKGRELYGLWEARQAIRETGLVVVVEGYMDVVALAQMGVGNAVATLGTATTPLHIQKLLRVSHQIVFAFDGDRAGRKAAWRALQACLPMLRDDTYVRFLFLPAEHDPDSFVRSEGVEAWQTALGQAMPLSQFLFDEWERDHDLRHAEGRAHCIRDAQPLLQAMPECGLRLQIVRDLAQRVRLTPDELEPLLQLQAKPSGPLVSTARDQGVAAGGGRSQLTAEQGDEPPVALARPHSGVGRVRGGRHRSPVLTVSQRLLRLLLAYPRLAAAVGERERTYLQRHDEFQTVVALLTLLQTQPLPHTGAVLQAVADSDLDEPLRFASTQLLLVDDLPDPDAELSDMLRHIILQSLRAEQEALVAQAGNQPDALTRYAELGREIAQLNRQTQ